MAASRQIRYKPIAIYGLLVKKEKCIDGLYIYYRDRAFHRVGEPKNAGLVVDPPDHSVLIVETTCEIGDDKCLRVSCEDVSGCARLSINKLHLSSRNESFANH